MGLRQVNLTFVIWNSNLLAAGFIHFEPFVLNGSPFKVLSRQQLIVSDRIGSRGVLPTNK
jgi:hypothetical protein